MSILIEAPKKYYMTSTRIVEEISHVGPPPGSVQATTVPLTFLDLYWMFASPVQALFFYNYPLISTAEFTSATLPALRNSLSLALQHFFPMAGRIVSSPHHKPHLLYTDGDSVPFTAFESHMDFEHLAGDHPRGVGDLKLLVPSSLPPARERDGSVTEQPVLAVQVTVFPNSGISIGVTFCHVAADGRSVSHFMKSWATINMSGICLSEYSRDSISDAQDTLASNFLKENWQIRNSMSSDHDDGRIRVTFVINQSQVEKLKDLVKNSSHQALRMSTFVATTALMWSCLVKAKQNDAVSAVNGDDPTCYFIFVADCREKLSLPASYFGNCIEPRFAAAKRSEVVGEKGVVAAAEAIGGEITEFEKSGALRGVEKWTSVSKEIFGAGAGHIVALSGSPKLKVYETDFGWGRVRKREVVHLGFFRSISITESRLELGGGVEFGLVASTHELDRFRAVFEETISNLSSSTS